MSYTVHLFASDLKALEAQMRDAPAKLLSQVREFMKDDDTLDSVEDLEYGLELLDSFIQGERDIEQEDLCSALMWMADAVMERVEVFELSCFRRIEYLEATGIWQLFADETRWRVGKPGSIYAPEAGAIYTADIRLKLDLLQSNPIAAKYSESVKNAAENARTEFVEVAESISGDDMDMFAILDTN